MNTKISNDKYKKYKDIAKKENKKIIYVTTDEYTIDFLDIIVEQYMKELAKKKLNYFKGLFIYTRSGVWKYFDYEKYYY
jgi:hypothetical protein